jgi:ABC-type glycerol-3-phosphate transport system substrate-binding protein
MSKRSSTIAVLSIFTLLVSAFILSVGVSAPVSAQDPVPTFTPAVASMGTGSTHISFWNGLTGSDGTTLNEMIAQFAAENSDYSVTTEIIPWATLYTKLQAAFVADEAPDLFLIRVAQLPQFVSYGVVADLSSWYTSGGGTYPDEDFAQPAFDRVWIDGAAYAIPLDNHGRGVWINLDMFEAAGLDPNDPPDNYEETVEMLKALTLDANGNNAASPDFDSENIVQWGIAPEWLYTDFLSYMFGMGGQMVSEDGTQILINSPEAVEALQRVYDLIYVHHVMPPAAGFDPWGSFGAGLVAINPTGTWFRNRSLEFDVPSQAWPVLPIGDERAAWIGSHVFVIPASTQGEQLEAVKVMLDWITDNQVLWASSGQVPARISAQEQLDPENYPSNILLGQTFQEYGQLEPACLSILEIEDALNPELSAALTGQKTPQQALDDAAARIQSVLDRQPC